MNASEPRRDRTFEVNTGGQEDEEAQKNREHDALRVCGMSYQDGAGGTSPPVDVMLRSR